MEGDVCTTPPVKGGGERRSHVTEALAFRVSSEHAYLWRDGASVGCSRTVMKEHIGGGANIAFFCIT